MPKKLQFEDSAGVLRKQIDVDDTTGTVKVYDSADAEVMDVEAHASRHAYGGADALAADALRYQQIKVVFGTEQTVSVNPGTQVISEGVYIARLGANTSIEYSPDGGTTWYTLIAAGGTGIVFSDGANVRFNNAGAAAENSYLLPIS